MTHQQADQRKHQQAYGACFVVGGIIKDLQHRARRRADDIVEIFRDKKKDAQVYKAREYTDQDTGYHDARTLNDRVVQFFDTMAYCVVSGQSATSHPGQHPKTAMHVSFVLDHSPETALQQA